MSGIRVFPKVDPRIWRTEDEFRFIETIGQYSDSTGLEHRELLRRYCQAIRRRTDWGRVDASLVKTMALSALNRGRE